jgi:hypothetical protein
MCESPGNAAQIAALSADQAPTAIIGCPDMSILSWQFGVEPGAPIILNENQDLSALSVNLHVRENSERKGKTRAKYANNRAKQVQFRLESTKR